LEVAGAEVSVLEFDLQLTRGSFHLHVEAKFASDWTVIFGPSGAGKSSLLRLLAGLDRPTRGRIVFEGEILTDASARVYRRPGQREAALVAQQPALFPHLSIADNVRYGISALDRREQAQRVDEMLHLVDAAHLAARRPRDLSGGEAQRVALARALAPLPRLLLLDEPFSALDGEASDALLSRLQIWLREQRVQTVLVTHDAADAFAASAEVALLCEGRIVGLGPPAVALAQERQRILARLATN
jgi:ABC-type sulfate/molybdate transport systems ATPase subunit